MEDFVVILENVLENGSDFELLFLLGEILRRMDELEIKNDLKNN